MPVHRIGFTELFGGLGAKDGPYRVKCVIDPDAGGHILKCFFKSKPSSSTSISTTTSIADDKTSEESPSKLFWPDEYLTQDIPEARVWTYGYNADAIGGLFQAKNKNSVSQHGQDFAARVEWAIQNDDPILFVVHSLGGIVVKDAICRSDTCRARTKLIIFLGTPHRGSAYAGWGEIASNLALLALQDSNKKIIETLEVNSEVLDSIHEKFKTIADQSRIQIHSFQEARGISGIKGLHNKVVDDFSSKLDLPRSIETVESIDANHMQMARCTDRADPQYRAIVGVLQQFIHHRAALPCHYIPLPENRRFVGRNKTLDTLKSMLFLHKEWRKAAIVGLGGVGKTQVALQLVYWTKKNRPEFSIFWVPALSNATFEQAFAAMAKKLPIQCGGDDDDLKESIRRYLSSEAAGPWLLVVDNADDKDILFGSVDMPGGIIEYLPESDNGLTLFTTRSREVAVSVTGSDVIELHEIERLEAADYLEKSLIQKDTVRDKTATEELLKQLTYLPLAITQAAAYINIKQVPLAKYLELLRGTQQDLVSLMSKEFRDNTRYLGSQNAVATTWLVSFDQIRKSDNSAADLLSFISCIEPKGIPQSLFPGRGDSEVFDMHNLVHLAARIWVQREGLTATASEKATRQLATVFPSDDYENRTIWRDKELDIEEKSDLLLCIGRCLIVDGRTKEAVRSLEEACQWRSCHFDEDHPSRLASQHELARAYQANGQVKEAITLLKHVVSIRERTLAEDDPDRLKLQHALARAYQANDRIKKSSNSVAI
ncbi:putative kinesin light chain [Corynascus novoguineensis]|uniref:Kinesin light chain n=1 Tax=Corynascus novoguineensis TaxID=1126955 RepID=A0AAN7CPA4_9PEZI|nr:putative kinesin light chain [Corynascus novoguineensis]